MRLKGKHVRDAAVKSLAAAAAAVWVLCSVCPPGVRGQEGDGCGHTVQGAESGTLASRSYPGTYPSNAWCRWRLRVPGGRTLRLLFGDFDVESSPGCGNGSVVVTDESGELILGPACGRLDAWQKNLTLRGNEASVTFRSGPHRSGRGFLLSYATDQHPELITCLQRGSHFSSQHLSAYCPAGCRDVTGDVWGNNELGYRDTSVLCKSAVHAGAVSDSLGGRVAVSRGRSLTLYESTFANGILSKMGSLSEKKLLFSKECNNILSVSAVNASSSWEKTSPGLGTFSQERQPWPAGGDDPGPWLELELRDRSSITGIVTTGTANNHMETFVLLFSKDRKNWKLYKGAMSKEQKVFTAYTDGHLTVLNSLFPPAVARFVRLQPLRWHGRASEQVQLLGCTPSRATPRSRSSADTPPVGNADRERTSPGPATTLGPVLVETRLSSSQPVIAAVGVVLALLTCGSCLLAGVWWRRRKKESQLKYSLPKTCQSFQAKSLSSCPQSDFISFPLERSVHDALPSPPLNDYAEPAVAAANQKMGSTFRPSSDEGYTTPFAFSHYDTPGGLPEYAEPLPPEPEYATPFSEQPAPESHGPLNAAATSGGRAAPGHAPYDCPSHRVLSNGYCTPAVHAGAGGPRPVSAVYAEPKSCDSVPQKHTYEKPL